MSGRYIATDPGRSGCDDAAWVLAEMNDTTRTVTIIDAGRLPARKEKRSMSEGVLKLRKYRDEHNNVYGIEKAIRNGRWVVVRTNEGGNCHGDKHFCASGNPAIIQKLLDNAAVENGWKEVVA